MDYNSALNVILNRIINDYNQGIFDPILEYDVVSHFYHIGIDQFGSRRIHLGTRVCGKQDHFFDIVIGNVNRAFNKPCIEKPELVIEVKFFVRGFSPQQLRRRFNNTVEDDIPKLNNLNEPKEFRYMLLFDEVGYMHRRQRGNKLTRLVTIKKLRDKIDKEIKIILIERNYTLKYSII